MGGHTVTVNELLDGHVALDIQCLDRIYLNTYVPMLQTSAQVVAFLSGHLGYPFPSPALFNKIGQRFRRAVADYAQATTIPWIKFGKDDDKLAVMTPHLRRQAATGCSGVAAIGMAQEFQRVWSAAEGQTSAGTPRWSFSKADRRVTCYYFYLWDTDFGPAFIKVCAYLPYPGKVWLNGHEWAKRQATKAGIGFTELSNGFAACNDPTALQDICDRLGPGTITCFSNAGWPGSRCPSTRPIRTPATGGKPPATTARVALPVLLVFFSTFDAVAGLATGWLHHTPTVRPEPSRPPPALPCPANPAHRCRPAHRQAGRPTHGPVRHR